MTVRVALITGGTRGIGRAISHRFADSGVVPVMAYKSDHEEATRTLEEIRRVLPAARIEQSDVSSEGDMAALVHRVEGELGRIDVLVHAAFRSGRPPKKTHEISVADWNEDLAVNLTGAFIAARAVLPGMMARSHGRIVFIGSLAMRGERGRAAYTTAKNGIVGLAKTIAQEYAALDITANVVSPGFIDAGAFLRLDANLRESALRQVPMRRLGAAAEVADAVWYFCREASYTTGQVLSVDGGVR